MQAGTDKTHGAQQGVWGLGEGSERLQGVGGGWG